MTDGFSLTPPTTDFPLADPDVMADMLRDLESTVIEACRVIDALRKEVRGLRAERDDLLAYVQAISGVPI